MTPGILNFVRHSASLMADGEVTSSTLQKPLCDADNASYTDSTIPACLILLIGRVGVKLMQLRQSVKGNAMNLQRSHGGAACRAVL